MVHNVHERVVRRDPEWLAQAIERLGEPDSVLWPGDWWMPMILDRPLAVGASGGHATIRYTVIEYERGRRVVFRFDKPTPVEGTHAFDVLAGDEPGTMVVRHTIQGTTSGTSVLLWAFVIRWVHDALIEDLLDWAEFDADARPPRGSNWSPWVRMLRRLARAQRSSDASVSGAGGR